MSHLVTLMRGNFVLLLALCLAACSGLDFATPSTGASMRIEVEVYKGPLAKDPEIQWADLVGTINEAKNAFLDFCTIVEQAEKNEPNSNLKYTHIGIEKDIVELDQLFDRASNDANGWSRDYYGDIFGTSPFSGLSDVRCSSFMKNRTGETTKTTNISTNTSTLKTEVPGLPTIRAQLRAILVEMERLAQRLRNKALFWAEAHVGFALPEAKQRRLPVAFSVLASTYADRLGSKADALIKQVRGDDRRELPLSIALRETNPTAYINQYIWNDAHGAVLPYELERVSQGDAQDDAIRARVRGIERQFVDENWSNINTVYASGQGTVRMAFIKDDIGNWSLKSFDQDPTDLLNAYKNIGLAALDTAAKVAATVTSAGGTLGAQQVMQFAQSASQFALNGGGAGAGPTLGSKNVPQLHAQIVAQLTALENTTAEQAKALRAATPDLTTNRDAAVTAYNQAKSTADGLTQLKQKADASDQSAVAEQATAATLRKDAKSKRDGGDTAAATVLEAEADQQQTQAQSDKAQADALRGQIGGLAAAQATLATRKMELDQAQAALDDNQSRLSGLAAKSLASAAEIIKSYENVITALEGAVVQSKAGALPSLSAPSTKTPTSSLPALPSPKLPSGLNGGAPP
jgi:hypothetical protein